MFVFRCGDTDNKEIRSSSSQVDDIFIHVCFHVRVMSPSSLSYRFSFSIYKIEFTVNLQISSFDFLSNTFSSNYVKKF